MESLASSVETSRPSEEPERLLIVRLGSMGDVIHTLPAVAALRKAFPQSEIGWVIEERWAELLCTVSYPKSGVRSPQRPLVDRLHLVNTKAWRKSLASGHTWHAIAAALSDLSGTKYKVVVDFQGAIRSALIARWSGAEIIYGAAQPRENVASMFYTRQVIIRGAHVVEQGRSLAEAVAHRRLELFVPDFPRDARGEQKVETQLRQWNASNFVLLNPGAGWGAKQWPPERYGDVARRLAEDGVKSLINFGPGEEFLMRAVESASGSKAKGVAGSLTELIALTRRARIFIGGDTGPMHLAAALGVPVVAIFGPTNPARNGPFGTRSIVLRSPTSPTTHSHRAQPDPGILEISPDEVFAAAQKLLRGPRG